MDPDVDPSAGESILLDKDSKINTLSEAELSATVRVAGFPTGTVVVLPEVGDRADAQKPGWVCFYTYPFKVGHVFPFSPLVQSVLRAFGVSPGQMMPQFWRVLRGIDETMKRNHLPFDLEDLLYSYFVNQSGPGRFVLQLKHQMSALVHCTQTNENDWGNKFFFVRLDSLGDADYGFLSPRWISEGIYVSASHVGCFWYLFITYLLLMSRSTGGIVAVEGFEGPHRGDASDPYRGANL